MRYKTFGKTNEIVSVIGFGTWVTGGIYWGDVDDARSIDAIRAAVDQGINLIDTAPIYGVGHSEIVVGQAIKGIRDKVFIATKFGLGTEEFFKTHRGINDNSRKKIFEDCENSLKHLQTDYIDLLLVHWPDPKTPMEETCTAMSDLQKQGKVRFLGACNFKPDEINEAEQYCDFSVLQHRYSILTRYGQPSLRYASKRNIGTMSFGSLDGGFLTGAYRTPTTFDDNDERTLGYKFFKEPDFSKGIEILAVMDKIANARGRKTAEVALNWNTQSPLVSTSLVGMRSVDEVSLNAKAMEWELTKEEMDQVDAVCKRVLDYEPNN